MNKKNQTSTRSQTASPVSCTSELSVCSSTDSNNVDECVDHYIKEMSETAHWTSKMDEDFITTYVNWWLDGTWDHTLQNDVNFSHLAAFLRTTYAMDVSGQQCQSRFYRFKKKWNLYKHLRGMSSKSETGVGWLEDDNCFEASDDHWAQLISTNATYKEFKEPNSCWLYDLFTSTMTGRATTGERAQSPWRPVPDDPQPRPRAHKSKKGKSITASSQEEPQNQCPWAEEDLYWVAPTPGGPSGKRPKSTDSLSNEREGSRETKMTETSTQDRLDDAVSKLSRFFEVVLEDKQARMGSRARLPGIDAVQAILKEMALPMGVRIKAGRYFSVKTNAEERQLFVGYDEEERHRHIQILAAENGWEWAD